MRGTLCSGNEVLLVLAIQLPCFSVTHERANNTHLGDKNYRENIGAYMADYSQPDIGQWIKKQTAVGLDKSRSFSLVIDTINYRATTPTGAQLRTEGVCCFHPLHLSLRWNLVRLIGEDGKLRKKYGHRLSQKWGYEG